MGACEILLWAVAAWWAYAAFNALMNVFFVPRLPPLDSQEPLPTLSVVIPARDEERRIGVAVAAHCGQDYPGLQVVVVDDGSSDATPQILAELAARFPALQVVRGEEPPEGWLGKPHAQMLGLRAARGELVLFVDADVVYAPGVHRRAAAELERRGLDMLLLLSRLEGRGLEPLVLSLLDAFAFYASPTWLMNLPKPRFFAFGAGSGNLVRRSAFEEAGGIGRLRAEVIDDVAMGRMMKRFRGRFRLVLCFRDIRVRMYEGFRGCLEGFTKNYYGVFGYSLLRAVPLQALDVLVHAACPAAAAAAALRLAPATWLAPALVGWAAGLALNAGACLWARHPLWVALAYPVRPLIWSVILVRSAWRYRRRGLVWRGRRYGNLT